MRLIVEDSTEKYIMLRRKLVGNDDDMLWAMTYKDAIKYLDENRIDSVYLDHDLGTKETGYDIAKHLVEIGFTGYVKITSYNPVGRERIRKLLEENDIRVI